MNNEPDDSVDRFLAFLEELYPGATSVPTYVGASTSDIASLLHFASGPIPPLYRQYVEVFGGGDGLVRLCDGMYAEGIDLRVSVFTQGNEACLSLSASTKKLDERIFHEHFRKAVPELKR
ncbi:MAG: hypothetical protein ACOY0T_12030 [Myxococcota bacterium]